MATKLMGTEEELFVIMVNDKQQNSTPMSPKEVLRFANSLQLRAEDEIVFLNGLGEDFTMSDIEYMNSLQ